MEYTKSKYTVKSLEYSKKYNLKKEGELGHNCETDAFRHAYTSASLSLLIGEQNTEQFGNWYEKYKDSGQSKNEENMDLWNNNQGREIASEIKKQCPFWKEVDEESLNDLIAAKVVQRMRKGKLITTPTDKRKFTGFAANIEEEDIPKTRKEFLEQIIKKSERKHYDILDDMTFLWNKNKADYIAKNFPNIERYQKLSKYYNDDGHWVTIKGNHVYIED